MYRLPLRRALASHVYKSSRNYILYLTKNLFQHSDMKKQPRVWPSSLLHTHRQGYDDGFTLETPVSLDSPCCSTSQHNKRVVDVVARKIPSEVKWKIDERNHRAKVTLRTHKLEKLLYIYTNTSKEFNGRKSRALCLSSLSVHMQCWG